jgi:hypothetical protein
MRNFTTTLALIFVTATSSAFAFDASDMHQGRTMTEASLKNAFEWLRVDQDPKTLTLIQIAKIEGILAETDDSDADKKSAVQQVIEEN